MSAPIDYERISIETGGMRVAVHGPDSLASQDFTVTTASPCVLHDDVVRMAIAVSGMLVTATGGDVQRRVLAANIPGDTDETLALTREMRDSDYAPLERAGVPRYAPTYGTVGLESQAKAREFLDFLGTLGVSVEIES